MDEIKIKARIIININKILSTDILSLNKSFKDNGGDILDIMDIIMNLENEFDITIDREKDMCGLYLESTIIEEFIDMIIDKINKKKIKKEPNEVDREILQLYLRYQ